MKKQKLARMNDVVNHIMAMALKKSPRHGVLLRLGWKSQCQILWDSEKTFKISKKAPRRSDVKIPGSSSNVPQYAAWEQMFNVEPELFGFVFGTAEEVLSFFQRVNLCVKIAKRIFPFLNAEGKKSIRIAEEYLAGRITFHELKKESERIKRIADEMEINDDKKDLEHKIVVLATEAVADALCGNIDWTSSDVAGVIACHAANLENCRFLIPFGIDYFSSNENTPEKQLHAERKYHFELLRSVPNPFKNSCKLNFNI